MLYSLQGFPKLLSILALASAFLFGCGLFEKEEREGGVPTKRHRRSDEDAPASEGSPTPKSRGSRKSKYDVAWSTARDAPTSTFGVDVDTASYTRVRASLRAGVIPHPKDVRIEEMLNFFRFSYPAPEHAAFGFLTEVARAPWNPSHRLVRIGIKGREVSNKERPGANIVLAIDASGSMAGPDKLELLKDGFALMAERLDERDTVAIVAYAAGARVVLPPTRGNQRAVIINALDAFKTGGPTDGSEGIQRAYELAATSFIDGGINRVLLATDGDFNVGTTDVTALESLISRKARTGVFLTVLGFGKFNPNDRRLETLADKGNGQYAFVDSRAEARRLFSEGLSGTLQTIAKDVKVQLHWDDKAVDSYRLLGYENRGLAAEDFSDDSTDAGDIGAGHTVTVLYEVKPVSQSSSERTLGKLSIRYKTPQAVESQPIETAIGGADTSAHDMSTDFRFASSVAAFGLALRSADERRLMPWNDIANLAEQALGDDAGGHRAEFVRLVRKAEDRYAFAGGGTSGGGDSGTGVAECDAYIKKFSDCYKAPAARAAAEPGLKAMKDAWKATAASPGGKDALKTACKAALDAFPTAACR